MLSEGLLRLDKTSGACRSRRTQTTVSGCARVDVEDDEESKSLEGRCPRGHNNNSRFYPHHRWTPDTAPSPCFLFVSKHPCVRIIDPSTRPQAHHAQAKYIYRNRSQSLPHTAACKMYTILLILINYTSHFVRLCIASACFIFEHRARSLTALNRAPRAPPSCTPRTATCSSGATCSARASPPSRPPRPT